MVLMGFWSSNIRDIREFLEDFEMGIVFFGHGQNPAASNLFIISETSSSA